MGKFSYHKCRFIYFHERLLSYVTFESALEACRFVMLLVLIFLSC
jgi:hypothetical protein